MAIAFADLAADVGEDPMTLAVAWVKANPAICCPIIGARSVEQLQPSLKAAHYVLGDELMGRMMALSRTPPPATDRLEEQR